VDVHAALIRTVIAPLWARWERSPYLRHLRRLRRTQYDDPETIRARQWAALRDLLRHAYATVPFYRDRLDRAGLGPDGPRDLDDYRRAYGLLYVRGGQAVMLPVGDRAIKLPPGSRVRVAGAGA
jgi:hypothetical protein